MKKQKYWIGFFVVLFALSGGAWFWISQQHHSAHVAEITIGGKVVKKIDLDAVTEPYTFTLETPNGGWNKIAVRPGEIESLEANCPDQICVHHPPIHDGSDPIVCLPHELVIRIVDYSGRPAKGDATSIDATVR